MSNNIASCWLYILLPASHQEPSLINTRIVICKIGCYRLAIFSLFSVSFVFQLFCLLGPCRGGILHEGPLRSFSLVFLFQTNKCTITKTGMSALQWNAIVSPMYSFIALLQKQAATFNFSLVLWSNVRFDENITPSLHVSGLRPKPAGFLGDEISPLLS